MRTFLLFSLTFSFAIFASSVVTADWYYDFEDPPEGLVVYPRPDTATTFTYSTDGYLRFYDPTPWRDGGTIDATAYNPEEFTDVRVSSIINPNGDTPNMWQLVFARNQGPGQGTYWASFTNNPTVGNSGNLLVGKFLSSGDSGYNQTHTPITDFNTPYVLQLDVQDAVRPADGREYVRLEARLFDESGSTLLLSQGYSDYGSSSFPIYASGYSGVISDIQWQPVNMDAAFDNISSVAIPEPSSIILTLTGLLSLFGVRRRS